MNGSFSDMPYTNSMKPSASNFSIKAFLLENIYQTHPSLEVPSPPVYVPRFPDSSNPLYPYNNAEAQTEAETYRK